MQRLVVFWVVIVSVCIVVKAVQRWALREAVVTMRSVYALSVFLIGNNSRRASMVFPATDLINVCIVSVVGLLSRANAIAHKRLMLLARMLIMDPAVARLVGIICALSAFIPIIEFVFLHYQSITL